MEKRRLVDDTIGQLLLLASQKADYGLLTEKLHTLHSHLQALFPNPKKA